LNIHYNLPYTKFLFTYEALEKSKIPPFKGSTLRGAFGVSLKSLVCTSPSKPCLSCEEIGQCPYAYIFETYQESIGIQEHVKLPHPYILLPKDHQKELYLPGEHLLFEVTLFGKALDYFDVIFEAFKIAGVRGLGYQRSPFRLFSVEEIENNEVLCNEEVVKKNYVELVIETPLRLMVKKKPVRKLDFTTLVKATFRRVDLMGKTHGLGGLDIDFREYIEASKEISIRKSKIYWEDWERYSNRQDKKITMGGLKGKISYEGKEIDRFIPYLKALEILHLGKGTVFGMGKVNIKE